MTTGQELVLDLSEQMNTIKLPLMALKLDELYRSPGYPAMDKLDFLSALLAPEFRDKVTKTTNNRLRKAQLIGTPCEIESCVDSTIRRYEPHGMPMILSSLQFIEDGLNVCILGASDSGKTYLAKSIGIKACSQCRVEYHHCETLLEAMVALKLSDFPKYQRKMKTYAGVELLILDDFLLHTLTEEKETKILFELLEKRNEQQKSTIVCSQRDPKSWTAMMMNDEVSSNAVLKRVTKHYTVVIKAKENI